MTFSRTGSERLGNLRNFSSSFQGEWDLEPGEISSQTECFYGREGWQGDGVIGVIAFYIKAFTSCEIRKVNSDIH